MKLDLLGQRFGRWIVIAPASNKNLRTAWLCKCDCGTEKVVVTSSLRKGDSKSCGCFKTDLMRENPPRLLPPGVASKKAILNGYKQNAKKKGLLWNITPDDFAELTDRECHYCGASPYREYTQNKMRGGKRTPCIYNGLDRIDSSKGYTLDNIVTACATCNWAKREMSQQEFYRWIETVYHHR